MRKGTKWKEHAYEAGMITIGAMTWMMLCFGQEELMSIFAIMTLLLIWIDDHIGGKEGKDGK